VPRASKGNLIPTGSFQHHQAGFQVPELLDQGLEACFFVGGAPSCTCRANRHVQPILGYVYPNEYLFTIGSHLFFHGPSLHDAGFSMPGQLFGLLRLPAG
jgi:hypothetical protein